MNKEKFNIEYVFDNVSRSSLWNHITTSRGLSSWFAEKVSIKTMSIRLCGTKTK